MVGANYVVTVFVGTLVVLGYIVAFLLQVVVAVLTVPLIACEGGQHRWHCIQSGMFRGICGILVVGLNPFWSARHLYTSDDAGVPSDGTGSLLFCNHRSNADPWFAAWLLLCNQIEARFVYKSTLSKIPFGGWSLVLAGDLPAKFGDREQIAAMLDQARDILAQGYNIMVFPEGTRSPSGLLQTFKPTFFEICAELGCHAVPVVLLGTEQIWPAQGFKMGCGTVTTILGDAIEPTGPDGGAQLSKDVERAFCDMAKLALEEGMIDDDDPLLTDQTYTWWETPEEFSDLGGDEQRSLLKAGKMHARGKSMA